MGAGEALGDKRNVTVVLRLLLDDQGRLLDGEALDDHGRSGGRFAGWGGLSLGVRSLLHIAGDPDQGVRPPGRTGR